MKLYSKMGICLISLITIVPLMMKQSVLFASPPEDAALIKDWPEVLEYQPYESIVKDTLHHYQFTTPFQSGYWDSEDLGDDLGRWHISTKDGWKGGHSWWCGVEVGRSFEDGYDDNWYKSLYTDKRIYLDGIDPVKESILLSFVSSYALEPSLEENDYPMDGINIQIREKGGDWELLEFSSYDANHIQSYEEYDDGRPDARGWSGEYKAWHPEQADLSGFADTEFDLRFTLASDAEYSTKDNGLLFGWRIDAIDISIYDVSGNKKYKQLYFNDGEDGVIDEGGEEITLKTESLLPSADDLWYIGSGRLNCNDGTKYVKNMKNVIVSPDMALTASGGYPIRLDFEVYGSLYDTNVGDDFWLLDVSANSGKTWYNLTSLNRETVKQKFTSIKAGNNSVEHKVTNMYPALDYIDLTQFDGDTLNFRFSFFSDGDTPTAGKNAGLSIDEFLIYTIDEDFNPPYNVKAELDDDETTVSWLPKEWTLHPDQYDDNQPDSYVNFQYEYGISYPVECDSGDSLLLEDVLFYTHYNRNYNVNLVDSTQEVNVYLYNVDDEGKPTTKLDSITGLLATEVLQEPTIAFFKNDHYFQNGEIIFLGISKVEPGGYQFTNPTDYTETMPQLPSPGKYDYMGILADKSINGSSGWVRGRVIENAGGGTWTFKSKWLPMSEVYNLDLNIPVIRINTLEYDSNQATLDSLRLYWQEDNSSTINHINLLPSLTSHTLNAPQGKTYYWLVSVKSGIESTVSRKVSITN